MTNQHILIFCVRIVRLLINELLITPSLESIVLVVKRVLDAKSNLCNEERGICGCNLHTLVIDTVDFYPLSSL